MIVRVMMIVLAGATFTGAASGYAKKPADTYANATLTCDVWQGRHSNDPKVDWDNIDEKLPVILKFTDEGVIGSASFPNAAFPAGTFPADVASSKPSLGTLRGPDRVVYQSNSRSVIDTITVSGLSSGKLEAVWQRFRLDDSGVHPTTLQGSCRKS